MFLASTADQRFWRRDEKILFAGEWCKPFSQRPSWENLPHEVLPYHWDDRGRFDADCRYLDGLYESALNNLADRLNQLHGVHHSVRYWRIIVGPWLAMFLCILLDRFRTIQMAENSGKATHTLIGAYERHQWVLPDNLALARCFDSDAYNQFLFSRIIERRGTIPFHRLTMDQGIRCAVSRANGTRSVARRIKDLLMGGARIFSRCVPDRLNGIVLISTTLASSDLAKLQVTLGQFPYLVPPVVETPGSKIDLGLREKLAAVVPKNEFESLADELIKDQIPSVYLEGYGEMCRRAVEAFPRRPRLIFNACSYEVDEGFKFWAADQVERGCRLVGMQHGFNYGAAAYFQEETHQIRSYDIFYTWGWRSDTAGNTRPLPAGKFERVRRIVRSKPDGRILLTTFAWPRYAYKMYSVPVSASGMNRYLEELYRFVHVLNETSKGLLLIRVFPNDRGWNQTARWGEMFPEVECYGGKSVSMFEQLRESRLHVTLPNGTPFLESLVADVPTVAFWNPRYFEIRPAARPHYDHLLQAGILHVSPESAAAQVSAIADDPTAWWARPDVQAAKDRFCREFAGTSDDWLGKWRVELSTQARSVTARP